MLDEALLTPQSIFIPEPDGEVAITGTRLTAPTLIQPPILIDPPILTLLPSISGFSPTSGARGTQVTINGSGFLGTQSVRFGGAESRAFTVAADSQIIAQVPPEAVTGPVTISGPNGSAGSFNPFTVLETSTLPIIDSFFPLSGQAGTRVTVNGRNLQPATQILFNSTPAAFVINTPTQILVDVPQGAASGRITVSTPAGAATSQGIFVVIQPSQLPAISGFSPTSGPAGTTVTIFGNNLLGTREVRFNGVPSNNVVVASTGEIRAQAPAGAGAGPITVITDAGSATSAGSFSVQAVSPLPAISFFNPISGQAGAQIIITGSNFINVTSVRFNGVAAGFFVSSPSSITATVPANALSGPISVTTTAGTATSAMIFTVNSPIQFPVITSLSPASGQAGTAVAIIGNNLAGATSVRFNGANASFTVQSGTLIQAIVPAGATSGPVSVTTPAGTAQSGVPFTIVAQPAVPAISGFTPASGQAGATVVVTGTQLGSATGVRFNGRDAAAFTVQSASQISAVVPLGATSGPISVTTPSGTVVSVPPFTVLPGALPGTRALKKRTAGPQPQASTDPIPVFLRAGDAAFFDEIVAERFSGGVRIGDDVQLSVVGKLPKGTATVMPDRVLTFADVAKVTLQAGVATPPGEYTIQIRGKSLIDNEDYAPITYAIVVNPAVLIQVDPASPSVRAGKSTTITVLLDRSPGAMGLPVSLSVTDLPDDATPKFGESPTAAASTTLKISTLQSTPVGTKDFFILGAATFQGSPVNLRRRRVPLTVKEPRVRLLIDPNKQSQTVEAGQTAEYPFTIQRNDFDKKLTVECDQPDFVVKVDPMPPFVASSDSFSLRFTTSPALTVDRNAMIGVRLRDGDGTLMASATVQLSVLGALTVALEIQDKEDSQELAGKPISFDVVIRKNRPSPELDLVVVNARQLADKNITATVTPARTPGTMAILNIMTRTDTPLDRYPVFLEARFNGQTLAADNLTLVVLGRVKLALDNTDLSGPPGATLSTKLRVVERVGFPGPVPVGIEVNSKPQDGDSKVTVALGQNPVADFTDVFLTIPGDDEPGALNTVGFFPDIQGDLIMKSIVIAFVTVK